ncbi:Cytochrome bd ubiquinol oxidase subunit 1 [Pseudodesulfovibrio profundus]|uniref:Cytochrome bd ubiquinol oxidase subunit 1 n=1 Tax=Pseudodesulfovibrio profundus TaxID=57320 RepID=A0A2C8FA44_9BACT|nr:cytochrome ubiquinol oxidase subunit I [Pseudodesulfovibrio profundus]MBC16071.1 cytochrome ubiquinol oxidase subunit I [Desulfovibrio sp.]SOB59316.1 Cytochrome bd ubiquinol oxidase subunit 1 [Pseudodesulfovibrio profundus]|tara:strand:- start:1359 stop:2672 length:1314 start_codon:yes stop_codon:yes gene_type:complete
MDVLMLSRLQFAAATMFHFIFVPLTLGLSVLIACMETAYVRTGNEVWRKMAKFWGKIFLVNFALGVVTGITLEFQFGTNWSRYSMFVGDIFGSLLAIEATAAFFLESTFIGVWHFGWNKLTPKAHAIVAWLVAGASNLSAIWILIANGFMQDPTGYVIRNGRAELTDFFAVITNKWAWLEFFHVIPAAMCLAGFFMMGVAAWHLLRKSETEFFQKSFSLGVTIALIFSIFTAVEGHIHGNNMALKQPTKLAAMESHWETQRNAPMYLLVVPGEDGNLIEALPIPGMLSFLAYNDFNAEVKGLNDFPKEDRPPVVITFLAFRAMVGIGTIMPALALFGWVMRNRLDKFPLYLKILPFCIPLPYIAIQAGWVLAEVGRQPWIVYGLMRTSDAVSPISTGEVGFTLVLMCALYALLGAAGIWLMIKLAKKGPEDNTPIQV